MAKLEVLVGMIASGKSTYARSRAAEGALIVCHDDLTEMLHGQYRYDPELKTLYRAMMIDIARRTLLAGMDCVIDRTHLTREARKVWVDAAGCWKRWNDPVKIIAVEFPVELPSAHAKRRFEADDRGRSYAEWLHVAEVHYGQAQIDPLNWPAEGFHDCIRPEFAWTGPKKPSGAECSAPGPREAIARAMAEVMTKKKDGPRLCTCGADRTGPSAEAHDPHCPAAEAV